MLRTRTLLIYTFLSLSLAPMVGHARSGGPDDNLANNPPGRQNCTGCHSDFALNSGRGSLQLQNLPESYRPGETYRLTVALADPSARRWGFELTSLDNRNNKAGVIQLVNQQNTQLSGGAGNRPQFLKHTSRGTAGGQANGNSWEFDWTAPNADIGVVSFYFTGNAANNNGGDNGDRIYASTANIEAEPPPPPPRPDSLVISLAEGWNFISSSVVPHALDLDSVFVGILGARRLEYFRNSQGLVFDPVHRVDEIGEWNPMSGYQIKVNADDQFRIFGDFADPAAPLTLNNGWNWIAYTRMDTIYPGQVLEQLGGNAVLVKDGNGNFADPTTGISNLRLITPGTGLMVQMILDQPQEFVWPAPGEGGNLPDRAPTTSHFAMTHNTGHSMNVTISEWNVDGQLSAGDEIAVRAGNDVIAGAAVVHEGTTFLTIWGDDNTTDQIDGAIADSSLVFTYWFAANDSETVLIPNRNDGFPITYMEDTYGAIGLSSPEPNVIHDPKIAPQQFTLNGVFPNPFNPTAEVSFTLSKASTVRITLRDNAGRLAKSLTTAELQAGENRFKIDARGLPAGVYLVSVETGGSRQMAKAILLK